MCEQLRSILSGDLDSAFLVLCGNVTFDIKHKFIGPKVHFDHITVRMNANSRKQRCFNSRGFERLSKPHSILCKKISPDVA